MTERETENSKKEKKGFSALLASFHQLLEKIRNLTDKQGERELTAEEKKQLQESLKERNERVERFLQTDYGKQTEEIRRSIDQQVEDALEELRKASSEDLGDKKAQARVALARASERLTRQVEAQPKDFDWKLDEIARHRLTTTLSEKKNELDRILLTKGDVGKVRTPEEEAAFRQIKKQMLMDNQGLTEAEADRMLSQEEQSRKSRYEFFSDREKSLIKDIGATGRDFREQVFEEYFAIVDAFPSEFSSDALRNMGMDQLNKAAEFMLQLTAIPGQEGQKIRNEYSARLKMRKMVHDGLAAVEHGAAKPEEFEHMMERFTPDLFDQLFKEEEVELAARLYEVGMTTIRSRNGNWIPSESVLYGAHDRESDVDEWVRGRMEKVIKAKYGLDDEQFKKEWSEQRVRRAMSIGKGYEMLILRMPEMVARGRLPQDPNFPGVVSPAYEDFVRPLDAFEHFLEKYQDGDEAANFLMFMVTEGKALPFSSRKQIQKLFEQGGKVDPLNLRLIDVVNFNMAGGPFTQSGWRREMAMSAMDDEVKEKWSGLAFRIAQAEHGIKDKDKQVAAKKQIYAEELKRTPVKILREAELQDGEILDPTVQEKVILETLSQLPGGERQAQEQRIARGKEGKDEFLTEAEDLLTVLSQLEIRGRKGEIDFSRIQDPRERRLAEAYYKAITKVVNEPNTRTWRGGDGEIHKGSLLDYLGQKHNPYTPILDDVPWGDLQFARMGQKGYARRMRDYYATYKVMGALNNFQQDFPKMRKAEDIVKGMDEIWKNYRNYTKKGAREKVASFYEGVGRFNAGNFLRRFLPVPFDSVVDFLGDNVPFLKETSYAKQVYGFAANSWRGIDLRNMLGQARLAGHITKEQERKLRKRLRCTGGWLALEYTMRVPLIGSVILLKIFLEELGNQLKEQAKQV